LTFKYRDLIPEEEVNELRKKFTIEIERELEEYEESRQQHKVEQEREQMHHILYFSTLVNVSFEK